MRVLLAGGARECNDSSPLEKGGVVVGDDVAITIDAEAILQPGG
jgi:hypothetical protein